MARFVQGEIHCPQMISHLAGEAQHVPHQHEIDIV